MHDEQVENISNELGVKKLRAERLLEGLSGRGSRAGNVCWQDDMFGLKPKGKERSVVCGVTRSQFCFDLL
jgi:hypothetical protein